MLYHARRRTLRVVKNENVLREKSWQEVIVLLSIFKVDKIERINRNYVKIDAETLQENKILAGVPMIGLFFTIRIFCKRVSVGDDDPVGQNMDMPVHYRIGQYCKIRREQQYKPQPYIFADVFQHCRQN
jgi:hypothetical protein